MGVSWARYLRAKEGGHTEFPKTLLDDLPMDVILCIATHIPDFSRHGARRSSRGTALALPSWGCTRPFLRVTSTHNKGVADVTVKHYFKYGITESQLFLDYVADSDQHCTECGAGTDTACAFRGTPICAACKRFANSNALAMEDVHTRYSAATIEQEFIRGLTFGRVKYLRRTRPEDSEIPVSAVPQFVPKAEMDTDSCVVDPDLFCRRFETRAEAMVTAVAWKYEHACRSIAKTYYRRQRKSKPTRSHGGVHPSWVTTLAHLNETRCVECAVPTKNVCPWFGGASMCLRCHHRVCGVVRQNEMWLYGVDGTLVVEPPQPGESVNSASGGRKFLNCAPFRYCARQISTFAAQAYGVPEEDVRAKVMELRALPAQERKRKREELIQKRAMQSPKKAKMEHTSNAG